MNINILKELFVEGALTEARICPAPMSDGEFILIIDRVSGTQEHLTKSHRKKEVKTFKQFKGAINDARRIGFKEVKVILE